MAIGINGQRVNLALQEVGLGRHFPEYWRSFQQDERAHRPNERNYGPQRELRGLSGDVFNRVTRHGLFAWRYWCLERHSKASKSIERRREPDIT